MTPGTIFTHLCVRSGLLDCTPPQPSALADSQHCVNVKWQLWREEHSNPLGKEKEQREAEPVICRGQSTAIFSYRSLKRITTTPFLCHNETLHKQWNG